MTTAEPGVIHLYSYFCDMLAVSKNLHEVNTESPFRAFITQFPVTMWFYIRQISDSILKTSDIRSLFYHYLKCFFKKLQM